mmetsp:Transcript_15657/g.40152  ORF Transcript_15657/g.40152 Transcript_15657/m.40152 type:complete len:105 (-) Transcript_15657:637-951(-)
MIDIPQLKAKQQSTEVAPSDTYKAALKTLVDHPTFTGDAPIKVEVVRATPEAAVPGSSAPAKKPSAKEKEKINALAKDISDACKFTVDGMNLITESVDDPAVGA